MKKIYLLCLVLCTNLCVRAQVTSLTIDNQTPGWLSSKIDYPDQQTVRNLKVTGYINKTDLEFIGSLTQYNLCGIVDLGDVTIIGNSWDGCFKTVSKSYEEDYTFNLQKLILPKTLTAYKEVRNISESKVDTLVFDTQVNKIAINELSVYSGDKDPTIKRTINHLIIGEKVDSIEWLRNVNSVHFSTSLKYLAHNSCRYVEDFSNWNMREFPNLEYLGYCAFTNAGVEDSQLPPNGETLPDSIFFPNIRQFCMSSFQYKEGMHIFFGEKLEELFRDDGVAYSHPWHATINNVSFHLKTVTPPAKGTFYDCSSSVILYVPKGAKQAYLDAGLDSYTIFEETVALERIELQEHELVLDVNESHQLSAKPIPTNADDATILWSSSNEDIVIVDDTGVVKAVSSGEANIFAKSIDGSKQDVCKVIVKTHAKSVTIQQTSLSLSNIGDTFQLEATVLPESTTDKSITWTSSNNGVCTITDKGLVTATGVGTAVITVTTIDGGHTATCVVKVLQHVSCISIDKHSISLKVGDYEQLEVKVTPDNADEKNVVWSSSDEDIASVSETGLVTAYKAGEAWIKVSFVDNPEANDSCKIVVIQPVAGINMSQSSCQLDGIGESVQLEATVLPADATNKEVNWKSSNESVCIVSHGQVVAVGYGTAVIIATTVDGGYMATCTVTVTDNTPVRGVDAEAQGYKVYDLQGRQRNCLQKGINIIRFSDGTTKKVLVK